MAPGETLPIELVWWNRVWLDEGYLVLAQAFDVEGRLLGQVDAIPAAGLYPTVLWYPRQSWRDRLALPIDADAPAGAAQLLLALYPEGRPEARLPVRQAAAAPSDHLAAGRFMVRPASPPVVSPPPDAQPRGDGLGRGEPGGAWRDLARLEAYRLAPPPPGEAADWVLSLYWRASGPLPYDYTVFVHGLDARGQTLLGADGPPAGGRFPSSLWAAGELIEDRRPLSLPAGTSAAALRALRVGLYLPASGERLAARDAAGQAWPDEAIVLPLGEGEP